MIETLRVEESSYTSELNQTKMIETRHCHSEHRDNPG